MEDTTKYLDPRIKSAIIEEFQEITTFLTKEKFFVELSKDLLGLREKIAGALIGVDGEWVTASHQDLVSDTYSLIGKNYHYLKKLVGEVQKA
jgi:hypothetical protein